MTCNDSFNGVVPDDEIGHELRDALDYECRLNKLLPQMCTAYCVPLIALVCSCKTTRAIAVSILSMLSFRRQKLLIFFENNLYRQSCESNN